MQGIADSLPGPDPRRRALICLAVLSLGLAATPLLRAAESDSVAIYELLLASLARMDHLTVLLEAPLAPPGPRRLADDDQLRAFHFSDSGTMLSRADVGSAPVELLNMEDYSQIFNNTRSCAASWQAFFQRYPKTKRLLQLSTIGMTLDRQRAAVLVHDGSACLGSLTSLYVLERRDGRWYIASTSTYSVS